jgi:hypothetical protein
VCFRGVDLAKSGCCGALRFRHAPFSQPFTTCLDASEGTPPGQNALERKSLSLWLRGPDPQPIHRPGPSVTLWGAGQFSLGPRISAVLRQPRDRPMSYGEVGLWPIPPIRLRRHDGVFRWEPWRGLTERTYLPSHQVRDEKDELAHIEGLRQVRLITGRQRTLSILRSRKRGQSQRGNPLAT